MPPDVLGGIALETASADELRAIIRQLLEINAAQYARIKQLETRVAELEKQLGLGGPPSPPPFVKANKPKHPDRPRKKRNLNFSRQRDEPTDTVCHVPDSCPDCGHTLSDGWVHRRRQIIDIEPSAVKITEHVIYGRYCGVCGKRVVPRVDLSREVLGKRRIGIYLTSLIAHLHIVARMPLRTIQKLLKSLFGIHAALGELTELLDAVAQKGMGTFGALLEQVRGSPVVHGDETGWREDGQSGYLWSLSTPEVRVFRYNKSRSGEVAQDLVGADFDQTLVTDFYCAYNRLACRHQRCWVHFLRDLHKLREGADVSLNAWIDAVIAIYERAKAYWNRCREGGYHDCRVFDRRRMRKQCEKTLYALAEPYLDMPQMAQCTLSKRIGMFLGELFTFVEYPEVPSENNAAERAVRPAVIARKISGGTRSPKGSLTKTILMSLAGTWTVQGKEPIAEFRRMLTS